jgi:subtilisin family serine protease
MALKFLDNTNFCGSDFMAIQAIDYAASFGVPIINASWGGPDVSTVLDATIGDSGALFVAAAGNAGSNMDGGGPKFYPAASTKPNVITVAAIDQRGALASFSNYGTTSVDLSAPGTKVLSAVTPRAGCGNPCWAWLEGTSMAAPHVSGVAALVLSVVSTPPTPTALRQRLLVSAVALAPTAGKTVTGKLVNALRAIDSTGPIALPVQRHGINVGSTLRTSTVSTTMIWPAATDDETGVRDYIIKRSLKGGAWTTVVPSTTTRTLKANLSFGVATRYQVFARDWAGNHSVGAIGPSVTASLVQDGTSLAKYGGSWSTVASSSASNGRLHSSTKAGAWVEFRTTARAIAIVGRKRPGNGKAKVYVDGVYHSTIDLYRSSSQSEVVVFNVSWTTPGVHRVRLVVSGTSGRPRIEVDAFGFLR